MLQLSCVLIEHNEGPAEAAAGLFDEGLVDVAIFSSVKAQQKLLKLQAGTQAG